MKISVYVVLKRENVSVLWKPLPFIISWLMRVIFDSIFFPDFIVNPSSPIHVDIDASVKARQISWKKFKFRTGKMYINTGRKPRREHVFINFRF